ncbi:MAG: tryptophan 2,3-dioxygenase [Bacteroidetes bacterium]|nr:tryptophan 2,3-dioxygenase [Bacteroidota bacterium]
MEITNELQERLNLLTAKYEAIGQDLISYLDGLLYSEVTTYWDYIQLDTLLSLQKPKTNFPDEIVFIGYHQITELYFKLALQELMCLGKEKTPNKAIFLMRVQRVNRYFEALIRSFSIMVEGMDQKEFLRFRMALLPASGFQSVQYRQIELYSTDLINLVTLEKRQVFSGEEPPENLFPFIYWKYGATEQLSGKKTLTLTQFENRYDEELLDLARHCRSMNLWQGYLKLSLEEQADAEVIDALKTNDLNVNVFWPLAHFKSAVRYLAKSDGDISATGGTNWQKYLPPKFQKRIFYPKLWSQEEKDTWGKGWVEHQIREILKGV